MIAAIIAAAGMGKRMGHHIPKPYLPLAGKPILAHTLKIFEAMPEIREVTVVVHPEDLDFCQDTVIAPFNLKKVLRLVPGGKERQDSVYHALKALQNEDELEIVLVHDGVRPFVTPEQIRQVIDAARRYGGAVLGLPAQDTLKRVDADGKVHQTLERTDIWQIQTPQAFQAPLLWRAFTKPTAATFMAPMSPPCWRNLGSRWRWCPSSPFNLKITTPEDLLLAEAILSLRRRKNHASRPGV